MKYLIIGVMVGIFGTVVGIGLTQAFQPTPEVQDKVLQGPGPNAVIIVKRNFDLSYNEVTIISIHGCEYIFYKDKSGASIQMEHFAGCQGLAHK